MAVAVTTAAALAANETDLRIRIEPLVDAARVDLGLTTDPAREKSLDTATNTITFRGRADTMYGALVIEYEPPGALNVPGKTEHAAKQAREYMLASASQTKNQELDALRRHAGVVFDGHKVGFLRASGPYDPARPLREQLSSLIPLDGPYPTSGGSMAQLLLYLRALGKKRLDGKSLATTFGPESKTTTVARDFVRHLCEQLDGPLPPKATVLLKEWMRSFGAVYVQDASKARQDAGLLVKLYTAPVGTKLPTLLFAVQTYYALLMKLLAVEVLSLQAGSIIASQASRVANSTELDREEIIRDLESGELFSAHGIDNFLEGDYFSWYLSAWTGTTSSLVRTMAAELAQFEPASSTLDPDAVRDLLKDLYQFMLPKKVRHDLGEYYTPDWLADYILDRAGYDGEIGARFLDPACGSGTFLLRAMARIQTRARAGLLDDEETARAILSNVVGFDLNPVAVLAARTNYLLGLGRLIRKVTPISLPVYLADSLLAPLPYSRLVASSITRSTTDHLVRPSSEGDFKFPIELASADGLRIVTEELERAVPSRVGADTFVQRVSARSPFTVARTGKLLAALYQKIEKLDDDGKNGIWARLLRNAFAPALSGSFDYVVGNPPWINWESLSDEYRTVTSRLWELHGLFTLTGMNTILGGSKRDIAMLFYVCGADFYLKDDGVLAYLFPQTTFQTSPSGDGFRRFRLGDSTDIGPTEAGDLVSIQPFEGASNWTGYIISRKNHKASYPIPYDMWLRNSGSVAQDASLDSALASTRRLDLVAAPSDARVATSPWVIGTPSTVKAAQGMAGSNPYEPRAGVTTWSDGVFRGTISGKLADGRVTFSNDPTRAKTLRIKQVTRAIEAAFLFPYIEWKDVQAFTAKPTSYILIPQDPRTKAGFDEQMLRASHPHTYDMLAEFRSVLEKRSGYRRYFGGGKTGTRAAFYSVFNFSSESSAPYRVVWATMGSRFRAAVVEFVDDPYLGLKPPQVKNTVISAPVSSREEAHYLAGLLNSTPLNYLATFGSVRGGKSFGSGGFLKRVRIPRFDASDPLHRQISSVATDISEHMSNDDMSGALTARTSLDAAAAELWRIGRDDLTAMRQLLVDITSVGVPIGRDAADVDDDDGDSPAD